MAITKSYTDFSQSKRMAEILPLESADGHWFDGYLGVNYSLEARDLYYTTNYEYLPAWSLAALLDVLPKIHGGKPAIALDDNYITYPHMRGLHTKAENLVDACVAMIEKLHELNLL